MRKGQDADQAARVLALRGLGFHAIVDRLEHETGMDRNAAHLAAARALHPEPSSPQTLAAELQAIVAKLDA
jgi:hypothetical protein